MAARKQLFHPDEVKKRIQASQLINRLQSHALADSTGDNYRPLMTDSQVRAAFGLLDKVVPNLKAVEFSGTGENGEIVFRTVYETRG
ncbi:MAG: hypothetical protein RL268_488 [Pseudomonadota bacterium]|jgi:hypothetical protein